MDLIVKKASALTSDEKIADGVTGIPDNWPVESYPYSGNVPDGFEQMTDAEMQALKDNNQASYDAWLQSLRPVTPPSAPQPVIISNNAMVTTQFEMRDKTIKLVNMSGVVTGDGTVSLLLRVPGTANPAGDITLDGRWISSGTAFFDSAHAGDMITSVRFVDHDNMIGQGVDFVVGSYTDDDADSINQGWFIPPAKGEIKAEAIGGYGFAPAGYYVMITAKKGGGITTGTFYVNLEWGKKES